MKKDQKREIYEVTRKAVRDELSRAVYYVVATIIGILTIIYGLIIFSNAPLDQSLASPARIIGIGVVLLGILIIGVLWKWDQIIFQYLPNVNSVKK